ncbi:MAG: CHAD domain-containing protein [Candidatus Eremiobacteraeota bacterium]|nr:CHAD domain-containing protein [Candidatus Eremiobacteraeota bacterium]
MAPSQGGAPNFSNGRPPGQIASCTRIRIAAKRARYAAEAVAPVAGRLARTLARALEQV